MEEVMAVQALAGAEELLIFVSAEMRWPIGLLLLLEEVGQEPMQVIPQLRAQVEQELFVALLGVTVVQMEVVVLQEHLADVQEERHLLMVQVEPVVDCLVEEEQQVQAVVFLVKRAL
jgi:hypothetical protein